VKGEHHDLGQGSQDGSARGWTNTCVFTRGGGQPESNEDALQIVVLNTASGTASSINARCALLSAAVERVGATSRPTVLVTTAGFFGCHIDLHGAPCWPGIADVGSLERELTEFARSWPESLIVAVGVDRDGGDQRQWWFAGAEGGRRSEILRASASRPATPLSQRRVAHAGYTLLGFVCGEGYEWAEHDVAEELSGVDVVVISAHVEVNRIWEPAIDEGLKRWAFQRRFRFISQYAGAALAHARGTDANYVRNCDDWFVHRGKEPFPGPRVGDAIG